MIPVAGFLVDALSQCPEVRKISLGFIKSGIASARGKRRVKVGAMNSSGCLLLSVRDNTSKQDIYVYTDDAKAVKLAILYATHEKDVEADFSD